MLFLSGYTADIIAIVYSRFVFVKTTTVFGNIKHKNQYVCACLMTGLLADLHMLDNTDTF